MTGNEGAMGVTGSKGLTGNEGAPGHAGLIGLTGLTGATGASGLTGLTGATGASGLTGLPGLPGLPGPAGGMGATGSNGAPGAAGLNGEKGVAGIAGTKGETGAAGPSGSVGPAGAAGAAGAAGPEGPSGSSAYAEFYALTPPDNAATVGAGIPVQFPENGPSSGVITRRGGSSSTEATEFVLPRIGTYDVNFSASVTEPGQLVIALDSGGGMIELPYTMYGRATGASQIAGDALVTTTAASSTIELRNPAGNTPALTITPLAGGAQPAVASIVIQQLG